MKYAIDSFPERTISINGKQYLYFGGTSYLGLQTDTVFQELFIQNIKKYGTNYGASRKANIQISVFDKVEKYLARLVGSEACTTMSSGYLAGQLVAQTLNTSKYEFFYAPDSHAAMHISTKKSYASFERLNSAVRAHLEQSNSIPVVFIDAIGISVDGYPNFEAVKALPLAEVILVVDDSHGIGIVGDMGCGAYIKAKELLSKELIVCCSLGKGFGIQAGAIFGASTRLSGFTTTDFFGGASPASPAALATLLDGKNIFEEKRVILAENIQLFLASLENPKQLNYIANYPAFYFSNDQIATSLEKNNILITNFNYPNEDAPTMSRIVLSAAHTKEDIRLLVTTLNSL